MVQVRPLLNLIGPRLRALPILVLYLTDGCNSRCATCDIWRLPRRNMAVGLAERLADEFAALGGRTVIFSGGEAMQHPEWPRIAGAFGRAGVQAHLLTNGLLLKKQAAAVIEHIDAVTLSLDGATPAVYEAVRGVDGLGLVLDGLSAIAGGGVPVTTRTTVNRANFRQMGAIVDLAKAAGARQASFLAVDVGSAEAFGPRFLDTAQPDRPESPALRREDLPDFAAILDALEVDHAGDFTSGFIAESPAKLRRLYAYFAGLHGEGEYPAPRCNAPHISTVIEVDGTIRPCFFLPSGGKIGEGALEAALNLPAMIALRRAYRAGERAECGRCVCPLYRGPRALLGG